MYEFLPVFFGILMVQASPGPNMTAVMAISLGSGRRAGMLAATGIAIGVFVWAILFSFGVGAFLKTYPEALTSLKLLGGGYVFYLGSKALMIAAHKSQNDAQSHRVRKSCLSAFKCGFVVVLTNPNTAMLWVVVSMFIASVNTSSALFLGVGLCLSISAICIYGIYAVLFSTDVITRLYHKFFRYIEAIIGTVLGCVGLVLIMDVLGELQG